MKPDPAALNLVASWAERIGIPTSLCMTVVQGESQFDLYAEGDGGLAHGGLQVRTDVHGHDRQWWVGLAGLERSTKLMEWRWQKAWAELGRDVARWHAEPVAFLAEFWHRAQGANAAVVAQRAPEVVREGMAVYTEWWRKQKPVTTIPKPPITWIGCASHNYAKGRNTRVGYEGICKHTTAGGTFIEDLDRWFLGTNYDNRGNLIQGSTPYGLGRSRVTGKAAIHQYVDLADTAFAQGQREGYTSGELFVENAGINANLWLIGEEHVDGGTPGNHPTDVLTLGVWLDAWLFQEVLFKSSAVPTPTVSRRHIVGHYQADSKDRPFCPSWPEDRYTWHLGKVNAMLAGPVPPPTPPDPPVPPTPPEPPVHPAQRWIDYLTAEMEGHRQNAAALQRIHGAVNDLVAAEQHRANHIEGILKALS